MSWTIESRYGVNEKLDHALHDAANHRIIMFCSSKDEGATASDSSYPGINPRCIKIGASTGTGARLSWVSDDCHFLLPGDSRHGESGGDPLRFRGSGGGGDGPPGSWARSGAGFFGSSVSTALAAGLAGVLLFCDRLVGADKARITLSSLVPGSDGGAVEVDQLRTEGAMTKAFDALCAGSDRFPNVGNHFPRDDGRERLVWDERSEGREGTAGRLRAFMDSLKKKAV